MASSVNDLLDAGPVPAPGDLMDTLYSAMADSLMHVLPWTLIPLGAMWLIRVLFQLAFHAPVRPAEPLPTVTIAGCPYNEILTEGLMLSKKKLRRLSTEDFGQLRKAVRWAAIRTEGAEYDQLQELLARVEAADADRKRLVIDEATAGRLPWPGTADRPAKAASSARSVPEVVRKAFVVPNEFRTAELDPSELTKLEDLARDLVGSPKKKLSKLSDDEVLEAGIALECALRAGEKSSDLRIQHHRFVQEWDSRDRRTPDESTLAERGVGELGAVLAVREQKRQEELAADWDAEFDSLAAELEQKARPSRQVTKRNRKAAEVTVARDEVVS